MSEEEMGEILGLEAKSKAASELVSLLVELNGGSLSEFEMMKVFRSAFSEIPFSILREASENIYTMDGYGYDDQGLNALLSPWIPNHAQ